MDIKFPTMQNAADKASIDNQRKYLRLTKIQLALLFLTTIGSVFLGLNRRMLYFILILMIGGFIVSYIIKLRKPEKIWYGARAITESLKTTSWRFMMRAEPFNSNEAEDRVLFVKLVEKIMNDQKGISYKCNDTDSTSQIINEQMINVRELSFQEKKNLYITERVNNQYRWYRDKSEYNTKWEDRLFNFSVITQLIAFFYVIILLAFPSLKLNLTAVFTSLVTISMTWLQLKQHYDLAQSYAVAANELKIIESLSIEVKDEKSFSGYVNDAENAISREHTLWIARRGQ